MYINKEDLLKDIRKITGIFAPPLMIRLIENYPPSEVRPNIQAYWEPLEKMIRSPYVKNYYCTNCQSLTLETSNFCGTCGAEMQLKKNK